MYEISRIGVSALSLAAILGCNELNPDFDQGGDQVSEIVTGEAECDLGSNGECVPVCPDPTMPCDAACVDLSWDVSNCGECGWTCGAAQLCRAGECECTGNLTACADGCFSVDKDPEHCGNCETACSMGQSCKNGSCK